MAEIENDDLIPLSHPGVTLLEDVMEPLNLTAYALAKALDVPVSRIDAIVSGRRSITADTAIRLGAYLGMRPEYWLALQSGYELDEAKRNTKINVKQRAAV